MNTERIQELLRKLVNNEPLPNNREWDYNNPMADASAYMPDIRRKDGLVLMSELCRVFDLSREDVETIFFNPAMQEREITKIDVANWICQICDREDEQQVWQDVYRDSYEKSVHNVDVDSYKQALNESLERTDNNLAKILKALEERFPSFTMKDVTVDKTTVTSDVMSKAFQRWLLTAMNERSTGQLAWELGLLGVPNPSAGKNKYETIAYRVAEKIVRKAREAGVLKAHKIAGKSVWKTSWES
jgi:hypothetical protein